MCVWLVELDDVTMGNGILNIVVGNKGLHKFPISTVNCYSVLENKFVV